MKYLWIGLFYCLCSCNYTPFGPKKTLVYCSDQSPQSFNPQIHSDNGTFNASAQTVYDRLIGFSEGSTELVPALAHKWEISENGLSYIFHLQQNIWFHKTNYFVPTRPFNADDVLFSFNRMRLITHPYYNIGGGSYNQFKSLNLSGLIADIKKVDNHTVEFTLTERNNSFLSSLAMGFASIFSEEYGGLLLKSKHPENMDLEPIGTGPFIFQRYVTDKMIRYKSNKGYYKVAPKMKELLFAIVPNPDERVKKMVKGECDLIAEPSLKNIKSLENLPQFRLEQGSGMNISYLAFNVNKEPFTHSGVRQALSIVLDKNKIISEVYKGYAEVANSPVPPVVWGHNDKVTATELDLEKARLLLSEAGFPNGFKTQLWIPEIARPYNPSPERMGELIRDNFAQIGVHVEIIKKPWVEFEQETAKGDHTMGLFGWIGDNGDPDNFLYQLLSCQAVESGANKSRWCNQEFSTLVSEARQTRAKSKRLQLYKKAQEVFSKQKPWIPIAHAKHFSLFKSSIKGYVADPRGLVNFRTLEIQ